MTKPALEARTIYRFFRAGDEETLALQGVSLKLEPGEVVAVVGPSGSGKSTLLSCLAGLDEPDGGTVLIDGERISHRPEKERAQLRAQRVGVLFQSGNMIEHLTIGENVELVQHLAPAKDLPGSVALLEAVGLERRQSAYPSELSGGEATRAGLAVAMANRPAILLADEPTGEVDGETETQLLDLLTQQAALGTAVLLASHSAEVCRRADRILRLDEGKLQR